MKTLRLPIMLVIGLGISSMSTISAQMKTQYTFDEYYMKDIVVSVVDWNYENLGGTLYHFESTAGFAGSNEIDRPVFSGSLGVCRSKLTPGGRQMDGAIGLSYQSATGPFIAPYVRLSDHLVLNKSTDRISDTRVPLYHGGNTVFNPSMFFTEMRQLSYGFKYEPHLYSHVAVLHCGIRQSSVSAYQISDQDGPYNPAYTKHFMSSWNVLAVIGSNWIQPGVEIEMKQIGYKIVGPGTRELPGLNHSALGTSYYVSWTPMQSLFHDDVEYVLSVGFRAVFGGQGGVSKMR